MMNIYLAEQQLSAIIKPQKKLILQRPASTEHGWPGHRLRQPSLVCRSTAGGTVSMDSHRLEFCVVILVVTIRTVRGVHTVAVVGYVQVLVVPVVAHVHPVRFASIPQEFEVRVLIV
eukprot:Selendium_serpulae@DN6511_c4_g2_i1.p1